MSKTNIHHDQKNSYWYQFFVTVLPASTFIKHMHVHFVRVFFVLLLVSFLLLSFYISKAKWFYAVFHQNMMLYFSSSYWKMLNFAVLYYYFWDILRVTWDKSHQFPQNVAHKPRSQCSYVIGEYAPQFSLCDQITGIGTNSSISIINLLLSSASKYISYVSV